MGAQNLYTVIASVREDGDLDTLVAVGGLAREIFPANEDLVDSLARSFALNGNDIIAIIENVFEVVDVFDGDKTKYKLFGA